jgi:hypothetical protein
MGMTLGHSGCCGRSRHARKGCNQFIELDFEILLENCGIVLNSREDLLRNLGHCFVLDELIRQRRHQISLGASVGREEG